MTKTCTEVQRKQCTRCERDKPLDGFRWRPTRNGTPRPRPICKNCENRENRARMADRRANAALYERTRAKQRADRAAKNAELAISTEITALIRATTARSKTTPPPLPTAEELAAWHKAGCPVAPHQRRRAVA